MIYTACGFWKTVFQANITKNWDPVLGEYGRIWENLIKAKNSLCEFQITILYANVAYYI